jgi:primosomal replication protein N
VHLVHSDGLREGCDFVIDYGSNVEHSHRRQVPVDLAANVCGIPADVLSQQVARGAATCTATRTSTALNEIVQKQVKKDQQ